MNRRTEAEPAAPAREMAARAPGHRRRRRDAARRPRGLDPRPGHRREPRGRPRAGSTRSDRVVGDRERGGRQAQRPLRGV